MGRARWDGHIWNARSKSQVQKLMEISQLPVARFSPSKDLLLEMVAYELIWNIDKYKLTWIYDPYYRYTSSIFHYWYLILPPSTGECPKGPLLLHIQAKPLDLVAAWAFHDANFGSVSPPVPKLAGAWNFVLPAQDRAEGWGTTWEPRIIQTYHKKLLIDGSR